MHQRTCLAHVVEHLLATPSREIPIIKVLLSAPDTQRTIDTGTAAKKFAAAQLHLTIVYARHRRSHQVPVCLGIKILTPASCHLDVLIVFAVRSCFDKQNLVVSIFCESSSNDTTARPSTTDTRQ